MKKVLVTGGSGFIGGHFKRLIEKDFDVTNYDLKEAWDIRHLLPSKSFDYVVHFAALRSIPKGELNPKEFIDTNCWGTVNLLRLFPEARFINISSSSVIDVKSVYGATKQFAESVVNMHQNALNIRLHNVFGEGQPFESDTVLVNFIKAKLSGDAPIVYGGGRQRKDFTYVGDVVLSIRDAMLSNKTGTVHFGYGTSLSVFELLTEVFGGNEVVYIQKTSRNFEIMDSKSPAVMPVIKYGRAEGLKRTIKWYESSLTRV